MVDLINEGEEIIDDTKGHAVGHGEGVDFFIIYPHGVGALVIKKDELAVFPLVYGGMPTGNLRRGQDDVIIVFPTDGDRGGELNNPIILGILAYNEFGHGNQWGLLVSAAGMVAASAAGKTAVYYLDTKARAPAGAT